MTFLEGIRDVDVALLERKSITPYRVPKFYREHIARSGHYERLKRIVEPSLREFAGPGRLDTSGEADNTVVPGLQHKYPQTGLLLVTEQCAAFCRYCFRKRFVGSSDEEVAPDLARIAAYIRRHPEMNNVLLSGGDPLMLSSRRLHAILDHLLPIPHLTSIRIGSKTPAFNPRRLADESLLSAFERIRAAGKAAVIVAHFDHFAEFTPEAEARIREFRSAGVQFLNQAVLLAGVNDDADTLAATFEKCHALGVRPYYLFQTRPVIGASHFRVPLRRGVAIVHEVDRRLSGIQKTYRYIMSHETGKIEILDVDDRQRIHLRYHQCPEPDRIGRLFSRYCPPDACWLDELHPPSGTISTREAGALIATG
jgi:KamA family protein